MDMASKIRRKLSFSIGDWVQESQNALLMPFDDRDAPSICSGISHPVPLAYFEVTHVHSTLQSGSNYINVSGVLTLGLSRNGTAKHRSVYF